MEHGTTTSVAADQAEISRRPPIRRFVFVRCRGGRGGGEDGVGAQGVEGLRKTRAAAGGRGPGSAKGKINSGRKPVPVPVEIREIETEAPESAISLQDAAELLSRELVADHVLRELLGQFRKQSSQHER